MTQRDGMGREVGGWFRTHLPTLADSALKELMTALQINPL